MDQSQIRAFEYCRSLTEEEIWVQSRGYPNVSTVTLPERASIECHDHNSNNTHYVTKGKLRISIVDGPTKTLRQGESMRVNPGTHYSAKAGPDGCTFVEGHEVLSPTTADRFVKNGTMRERGSRGSLVVINPQN
ncbi:hypothetical protein PVAG01_00801 [Phlyctema vagabunda]|uniref:Cupin type-2 domain-containing protein n=1 Tax=Phlyctema vagabunda TaxID=108571 RepID=A0ABR4PVA8_9HELO